MNYTDLVIGKVGVWRGSNLDCDGMFCIVIDKGFDEETLRPFAKIVPLSLWKYVWISEDADDGEDRIEYSGVGPLSDILEIKRHLKKVYGENDSAVGFSSLEYLEIMNYLKQYENNTRVSR